jgi:hypothetical protein
MRKSIAKSVTNTVKDLYKKEVLIAINNGDIIEVKS